MYRVLIAEDSKPILRNIQQLLRSMGLPLEVAAAAANGEEALAAVEQHAIDILITDIRMPKMDGLTLIEEAKRINPGLKSVLISGYNDFDYARKAIKLQVNDYLLKPVEQGALMEVMNRIIALLGDEDRMNASDWDGLLEPAAVHDLIGYLSILRQPRAVIALVLPPFRPVPACWGAEPIERLLNDAYPPHPFRLYAAVDARLLMVLVDPSFFGRAQTADRLASMRAALQAVGIDASLAAHSGAAGSRELAGCWRNLIERLDERMTVREPCLIDDAAMSPAAHEPRDEIERIGARCTEMIRKLQREPLQRLLAEQLDKWEAGSVRIAVLRRFTALAAGAFAEHPAESEGELTEEDGLSFADAAARLFELPAYDLFRTELLALIDRHLAALQSRNKKGGYELFRLIDNHLRANLYGQVTMNELADAYHVSPSYISRLMKRFAKRTLMQHYLDLKIKEARAVMTADPAMKIKELSDALGFYDQHYFSKVFKEYAGCSPTEYRKTLTDPQGTLPE